MPDHRRGDGVATDLTPYGSDSVDYLNQAGQVLGSYTPPEAGFRPRGYIWQDGVFTDLGTLADGDIVFSGWRQPMNDLGDVIGASWVGDARIPFLHTGGRTTELPTDAGVAARPLGLDNIGDVVAPAGRRVTWSPTPASGAAGSSSTSARRRATGSAKPGSPPKQGDILAYALDSPNGRAGTFLLTGA